MKFILHLVLLAILLIVSGTVVVLYYTQPFTEHISFKSSIAFGDIDVKKTTGYESPPITEYLASAQAQLGTLELENKGYFTKVYILPVIVGCIDISKNVDPNSLLLNQNQFSVMYQGSGTSYSPNQQIEIGVGEKKTFLLMGTYQSYNIPIEQFSKENIEGVSLYQIAIDEDNPIGSPYAYYDYSYPRYGYNDCVTLRQNQKATAQILLN